ncbi:unnamed protein product [Prunus brigantina]
MKFMFVGILSAHAMKVLDKKKVKRIPSQYILNIGGGEMQRLRVSLVIMDLGFMTTPKSLWESITTICVRIFVRLHPLQQSMRN